LAPAVWLASLGALVCSLDSALNVAFPAISAAFGVAPGRVALLIVFYHVPIGILTVLGGLLGDRFGHRHVFAAGVWTARSPFRRAGARRWRVPAARAVRAWGGFVPAPRPCW
jgi:MFS family permease